MAVIGLVVHHERPEAADLARSTAAWLSAAGHEVRVPAADAATVGLDGLAVEPVVFGTGLDLAVSLGGDGTMLRTVDLVATDEVPVLGVNIGHLGYLADIEPADLRDSVDRVLRGDYQIEERMLLEVTTVGDGSLRGASAEVVVGLNELVVEKTPSGHTVRIAVDIDGRFFTTYATDGLIVATPTGSTAYALSVRGPIVAPTHRALILTPVSPHMLFDRSLVLESTSVVRLTVDGHQPATVRVDGRALGELGPGAAVACSASEHVARLVVFGPRDFHGILKSKFKLGDR